MPKETRGGPRPNSGPEPTVPNGKRFNLYLNASDVDRVRETGQPISKFVREAIAEKLDRKAKVYLLINLEASVKNCVESVHYTLSSAKKSQSDLNEMIVGGVYTVIIEERVLIPQD